MNKIKAINPHIIAHNKFEKPYYEIFYYDVVDKEWSTGCGSYDIKNVEEWLNEYFEVIEADVEPVKHGHWKDTEYGTCSVCNRSISDIYDADSCMTYGILAELTKCPFCGAKMDEIKDDGT